MLFSFTMVRFINIYERESTQYSFILTRCFLSSIGLEPLLDSALLHGAKGPHHIPSFSPRPFLLIYVVVCYEQKGLALIDIVTLTGTVYELTVRSKFKSIVSSFLPLAP